MPPDYAPRHPYLKLALVSNTSLHGTEIPDGAERTFLLAKATSIARGTDLRHTSFPVHQPRSFRRHELERLNHKQYLVSLKTDGVRYLLLLTRYNHEPRAVLIDRGMRVREIEVWATDEFFNDTLIDGEMVTERNPANEVSDAFLAFDLFACRGRSMEDCVYSERLSGLYSVLLSGTDRTEDTYDLTNTVLDGRKICAAPHKFFRIAAKAVMSAAYTDHIWEARSASLHMNDGLIFTPNEDRKSNEPVLKWKPLNTIDVLLRTNPNRPPSVLIRHSNKTRVTSFVDMGNGMKLRLVLEPNVLLASLIEQGLVKFVAECACFIKGRVAFITPIRARLDKDTPNHIHVVKETLHNVIESVSARDIIELLGKAEQFTPSSPAYNET